MTFRKFMSIPVAAVAAFVPGAAMAHDGTYTVATFGNGLVHPLSGLDHIVLLALSGLAIGFMVNRGWRPAKGAWLSLAGLFAIPASMIAEQPYGVVVSAALLCFGLSLIWKVRSMSDGTNVTLLAATAIALQLLSHFLARGDAQPNGSFALGFAIGSLVICCAALSLTVVASRIVRAGIMQG